MGKIEKMGETMNDHTGSEIFSSSCTCSNLEEGLINSPFKGEFISSSSTDFTEK